MMLKFHKINSKKTFLKSLHKPKPPIIFTPSLTKQLIRPSPEFHFSYLCNYRYFSTFNSYYENDWNNPSLHHYYFISTCFIYSRSCFSTAPLRLTKRVFTGQQWEE